MSVDFKKIWGARSSVVLPIVLTAIVACIFLAWRSAGSNPANWQSDITALVIPDEMEASGSLFVQAWQDAAAEEGVRLQTVTASEFARHGMQGERAFSSVILPDTIHRRMTTAFVNKIKQFASGGGAVMLVYDAGILNEYGFYAEHASRLSDLAGIDYALYSSLKEKVLSQVTVSGKPKVMIDLHIPPGRWIIKDGHAVLSGYGLDILHYPALHTSGNYRGTRLMEGEDNSVVAGENSIGKGKVLFVNLPLGYLKLRTDGVLLHGFLQYFVNHMLQQPKMATAPEGIGGLILNWHCDAKICVNAMQILIGNGTFKRGPFSIHVTAGPDQRQFNDGLGVDLAHNAAFTETLRGLMKAGHEIGSHGGWIHDWFGLNVNENNQASMETYLQKNADAIEELTGKPQTEYSAPTGNQPAWVTRWLDDRHVKAYYFTGNIGQGPTRTFRDGRRDRNIWSFPVQTYGQFSTIEEAYIQKIPESEIAAWLKSLVDFTAATGEVRLIYFHPPGAVLYLHALDQLLAAADKEQSRDRFRWRTMTEVALFQERREKTRWSSLLEKNTIHIVAENPESLDQITWLFPKKRYARPLLESGAGRVVTRGDEWAVIAGACDKIGISVILISGDQV